MSDVVGRVPRGMDAATSSSSSSVKYIANDMDVGEWQAAELMPRADIAVTGSPALSDALSLCAALAPWCLSHCGHNCRQSDTTVAETVSHASSNLNSPAAPIYKISHDNLTIFLIDDAKVTIDFLHRRLIHTESETYEGRKALLRYDSLGIS